MIILVGTQGSGKGTQAQILAEKYRATHLSTGEMLRQSSDPRVHAKLESGRLFDDTEMTAVLKEALGQHPAPERLILDGYPRNLNQRELLEGLLKQTGQQVEKVINITLPEAEALKRMLVRGRADDTEGGIKQRLKQFKAETQPMIEAYQEQGVVTDVDGAGTVEEVAQRITQVVPWH